VTFTVLLDPQGAVYNQYRAPQGACNSPFPLDFILDRQGVVRYWKCEYDPQAMVEVIEGLLAGGVGVPAIEPFQAASRLRLIVAPDPFRSFTTLHVEGVSAPQWVATVGDASGRLVRILTGGNDGTGNLRWDGRDANGRAAPSGVYFIRLQADGQSATAKVHLIR
jgi:hypothetical protein